MIEQEIRGKPPDERRAERQKRSRPILDAMKDWLKQTLPTLSQKSAMAKAIRYTLNRWEALGRYCDDGHIEMTIMRRDERCDAWRLGARTFCSPEAMPVASEPQRSTARWALPN